MHNYIHIQNKKVASLIICAFKLFQKGVQLCRKRVSHPDSLSKHSYDELVCITGFVNSGSGTVIDFLSEFDNTTVYGGYDDDSGGPLSKKSVKKSIEIDFLRSSIGVFALEYIIDSTNEFLKHTMMALFITHSEYYYRQGGFYSDQYMKLTWNFINKLVEFKVVSNFCGREFSPDLSFFNYSYGDYKNLSSPFIANFANEHNLYFLKKMTKEEYISLAGQYVQTLFKSIESKKYLILDQVISDGNPDVEYHMKYCGPLKEICIYRDPRDVYTYTIENNVGCTPHNPRDFIIWYLNKVAPYISYQHDNYLILRFEDMVLDYENATKKIMAFLGLNKNEHVLQYGYFDPSISKKNIGIHKCCNDKEAIATIENALYKYCYNINDLSLNDAGMKYSEKSDVIEETSS